MSTPPPQRRLKLPPSLRGARAAVTLLTGLPVGGFPYSDADWRWAAAYFPVVGAALGLVTSFVFVPLAAATGSALLAAAATTALSLLLTGALHEDGLADSADALGGARDRAQIFVILKDSRIGTFGAAALAMSLLIRVTAVAALGDRAAAALVFVAALSRLGPVWLMARLPYVTPEASRSAVFARTRKRQAVLATVFVALLLWLGTADHIEAGALLWTCAATACAVALCGWRFRVRAGGFTGDFLGAAQQVGEAVAWVTLAATVTR